MSHNGSIHANPLLTIQIRPYAGASGYTFEAGAMVHTFIKPIPQQTVQHRCYPRNSGFSGVCGFNN